MSENNIQKLAPHSEAAARAVCGKQLDPVSFNLDDLIERLRSASRRSNLPRWQAVLYLEAIDEIHEWRSLYRAAAIAQNKCQDELTRLQEVIEELEKLGEQAD